MMLLMLKLSRSFGLFVFLGYDISLRYISIFITTSCALESRVDRLCVADQQFANRFIETLTFDVVITESKFKTTSLHHNWWFQSDMFEFREIGFEWYSQRRCLDTE